MTVTPEILTDEERRLAVEHWLLAAAEDRTWARNEWERDGIALLRCGGVFGTVHISADIIHGAAGSDDPAAVNGHLAKAVLGGPVVVDQETSPYYVLVGRSTGSRVEWERPRDARESSMGQILVAKDGMPVVTTLLPREVSSVPAARRLVRSTLTDWQLPALGYLAELVVAELVSNTVRHARDSVVRVTLRRIANGGVRVAVTDKSHAVPVLRPLNDDALDGRGLAIVDAVSRRWGTDLLPWGKRVWAELGQEADIPSATKVPMFAVHKAQALYVLIVVALAVLLAAFISTEQP
ncbi:ATP-binding protein [Streptomyces shenzhenensis]|uniref:ATP-binding protein n=1 Tax=Streptomyces shenzhenensis TaxID=943815 RepID=UPI0033DA637C